MMNDPITGRLGEIFGSQNTFGQKGSGRSDIESRDKPVHIGMMGITPGWNCLDEVTSRELPMSKIRAQATQKRVTI
jgi:hypothetical protein